MIAVGKYPKLSSKEYHGDKNSISRSALMDFKKCARAYWAKHLNPNRPAEESKASWEFGTAFHTLILEPEDFDKEYIVKPSPVFLKDVGREAYDDYKKKIAEIDESDKKVITEQTLLTLYGMRDALFANDKARELIQGGVYECSYFFEHEPSQLIIKSRPDILHDSVYVDLKTIEDASPYSYQRDMVRYGYHIQAALVKEAVKRLEGKEIKSCINICVEKSYPYLVAIYIIDELAIEVGKELVDDALLNMKTCIIKNEYHDYPIQIIGLPNWA